MKPIEKLEDLSDEDKDRIIFGIMHYNPIQEVRDRILEEVIKFKWTDSEEFGFDIYQTLPPDEQLISAGFEWRKKHWRKFFEKNDTDGKDEPRNFNI